MLQDFLITLAIWTAIAIVAYWLLFHVFRMLVGRIHGEADNVILRTVRLPLFVAIVAYGLVSALNQLRLDPAISDIINKIYVVVLIAAGFYLAWRIVKEVVLQWLSAHAQDTEMRVDDILVPLVSTVGPLVFFLVALIIILQYLGIDVALVAASIGVVGLVVGLAFQDTLSNIFSGIYLILDPPFYENDLIILPDGKIYSVHKVGLRMTQLYDMSNHSLIYTPNNQLSKDPIANITKPTVDFKVKVTIHTAFSAEPKRVCSLLKETLQSHRNILGDPAIKLQVLRKRIGEESKLAGQSSAPLYAALDALCQWESGHSGDDGQIHTRLLAVRKEMNTHLGEAHSAIKNRRHNKDTDKALDALHDLLGGGIEPTVGEGMAMDESRMTQIKSALDHLSGALPAADLAPLARSCAALEELDRQENALESILEHSAQSQEQELDRLLDAVCAAASKVSDALQSQGFTNEAARVTLWAGNLAVQYVEQEVIASIADLDKELGGLVAWLRELEAGGLTKEERARVRGLFGKWGGILMVEKRRIGDLSRRLLRWVEWKEKDTLHEGEYAQLVASWERRLRLLSRKLVESRMSDEESLDTQLASALNWLHSVNFWEPLADWKLPGAGLGDIVNDTLEFNLGFYVDDIKLEHFGRKGRVTGDVLNDVYEVLRREKIEMPTATG